MNIPFDIHTNNKRHCVLDNHIQHPLPIHINYENWRNVYKTQLNEMFMRIVINTLTHHKIHIEWSDKMFEKFAEMVFYNSSKHLSNYT